MRSASEYLDGLKDDRHVYVDGRRVEDVADHPAFAGVVRTVAELYDVASSESCMQYDHPEHGRINAAYLQPRDGDDLRRRRAAVTRWAEVSNGFVGRSPDHVGSFYAGFASAPEIFDQHRPGTGANVQRHYAEMVREDLYVTYTIIPPQNAANRPGATPDGNVSQVAVVDERDDGIVVRGAQMLGTGTAVADRLFVSCIKPLRPGEEDLAISFAIPVATPGLKLFCRRPYAVGQPSAFDYPLSSRFDEPDSMAVFDDVLVPWEDVFVLRSIDAVRDQFHRTSAHVLGNTQAQTRLSVKLKFLLGVAVSVCETNGLMTLPPVQDKLGELASLVSIVEGMVLAGESSAEADEFGVYRPGRRFLYGVMGLQSEIYPRVLHILRELSGAGVIGTASSFRDLVSEETADDMVRFLAESSDDLERRTKLFKLAWDAIGSEFAGRHHQYEMFYAGAPFIARGYAQRNYGFDEPKALAQRFLDTYALPREAAGSVS
jgi:4-hydroxyphenylacetate 3-monooxygenase